MKQCAMVCFWHAAGMLLVCDIYSSGMAVPFDTSFTRTTEPKLAVGALCRDNYDFLHLMFLFFVCFPFEHLTLECPKRAFRLRLGPRVLENFNVFFTTKNLQLVYPPLWQGPFNENPYTKLRLGRSKVWSAGEHNCSSMDLRTTMSQSTETQLTAER